MAYHVKELPLYPAADLEAALNDCPVGWTLKFVLEAVPVQIRQSKAQVKSMVVGGAEVLQVSPTAIFIFTG